MIANQSYRMSSNGSNQLAHMIKGSINNSALNSYNNSSDESARGGSTGSVRGAGLMMSRRMLSGRTSQIRNRSSDNHPSTTKCSAQPQVEIQQESPEQPAQSDLIFIAKDSHSEEESKLVSNVKQGLSLQELHQIPYSQTTSNVLPEIPKPPKKPIISSPVTQASPTTLMSLESGNVAQATSFSVEEPLTYDLHTMANQVEGKSGHDAS